MGCLLGSRSPSWKNGVLLSSRSPCVAWRFCGIWHSSCSGLAVALGHHPILQVARQGEVHDTLGVAYRASDLGGCRTMQCERWILPCLGRARAESILPPGYRRWTASLSTVERVAAAAADAAGLTGRLLVVVSHSGHCARQLRFCSQDLLDVYKADNKCNGGWRRSCSRFGPTTSDSQAVEVTSTMTGFAEECKNSNVELSANGESATCHASTKPKNLVMRGRNEKLVPATAENVCVAASALEQGDVIAVPTDTLYGLAADAQSASAIFKLYEIKGRDLKNPLAICVGNVADIPFYGDTRHLPEGLLVKLLPGPVTLILPRHALSRLHPSLCPGVAGIGVRVPDTAFIRDVARSFGGALALTSANVSGGLSPVSVMEFESLWHHCTHVFDAGTICGNSSGSEREGSTVVELVELGRYRILRAGSARDETAAILKEFGLQDAKQK
ncbi:hypothetical protein CBR_g32631 [Chara braunii]|uniref:Threonylcarbamoyl-AMP synthase n=1 Tax=Chara braunii TaxID=69332 RepID=A0A388LH42_CHABU|nr:hypothetical protein CBR_g32631 [Chara braunii]|eukprot:GBG81638.1 hypothetical protein CBR_g32631 [Chara braunii]